MFFSLSGFLVTGSLERSRSPLSFLRLRACRILPALSMEVVLSALILGPLLTTYPLSAYFSDPRLHAYFLNVVGYIHYFLPGVFANNPIQNLVDAQLWTVPWEMGCYIMLGVLGIAGLTKMRLGLLGTSLILIAVLIIFLPPGTPGTRIDDKCLLISFFSAAVLWRYRHQVPWHPELFGAALIVGLVCFQTPLLDPVGCILFSYVTVWLGVCNPPRLRMLKEHDYSYGLYVFGYPIQQTVASFGPALQHWYWNLVLAVPASLLMAMISWHLVERPALAWGRSKNRQTVNTSPYG